MTRSDFNIVAQALGLAFDKSDLTRTQMDAIVASFSLSFSREFSRFDNDKFKEAVFPDYAPATHRGS